MAARRPALAHRQPRLETTPNKARFQPNPTLPEPPARGANRRPRLVGAPAPCDHRAAARSRLTMQGREARARMPPGRNPNLHRRRQVEKGRPAATVSHRPRRLSRLSSPVGWAFLPVCLPDPSIFPAPGGQGRAREGPSLQVPGIGRPCCGSQLNRDLPPRRPVAAPAASPTAAGDYPEQGRPAKPDATRTAARGQKTTETVGAPRHAITRAKPMTMQGRSPSAMPPGRTPTCTVAGKGGRQCRTDQGDCRCLPVGSSRWQPASWRPELFPKQPGNRHRVGKLPEIDDREQPAHGAERCPGGGRPISTGIAPGIALIGVCQAVNTFRGV